VDTVIDKVHRQVTKNNLEQSNAVDNDMDNRFANEVRKAKLHRLPNEVEKFIEFKLKEWDADQSGHFTRDEVKVAMEELSNVQAEHGKLKGRITFCFLLLFIGLGCAIGAVAVVMVVTRQTTVESSAEMRAEPTVKTSQKLIVETNQETEETSLGELLDADEGTDQWLVAEDRLRSLNQVSFRTTAGHFYNLFLAELIRIDSGPAGGNDQINIRTTGGHQLRYWESIGETEVKWASESMWMTVDLSGQSTQSGRLLKADEKIEADSLTEDPPRRLFTKGGHVVFVGYPMGIGHGHHSSRSSSTSACQGRCNVPNSTKEPCIKFCPENACYDQHHPDGKVTTYICKDEEEGENVGLIIAIVVVLVLGCCFGYCAYQSFCKGEKKPPVIVDVVVPYGKKPGDIFQAYTEYGPVEVTFPPGAKCGDKIAVQVPNT
jgi:hypothetical protein